MVALPYRQTDTGDGVLVLETHVQDVARFHAVAVAFVEEARSGAGGVEEGDLIGVHFCDGVGAVFEC